MANKFDRIIQENFRRLTLPVASRLFNIQEAEVVYMDRDIHRTLEREMDTLLKFILKNGTVGLLDMEWQAYNDPKMCYRMLLYHALSTIVYDLPVIGVVLYIGKEKINMPENIDAENLKYNYVLIDFTTFTPSTFITSDIPEEVIMAILAGKPNFREKREIVRKILYKLQLLLRHDESELNRLIGQLEIIGELRNAQKIIIEEEKIMAIAYNIEKDIRYKQGLETGREAGLQDGLKQATTERNTAFIISLLQNTSHSIEEIAKLVNVSPEFVINVKNSLIARS